MRRILLALAVISVALSACEIRAEISVNDDGSGTVGMVFLVEPELLEAFGQSGRGGDPFADLRTDLADDPVAWEVDEFGEGRLKGIRASFGFASIADLNEKMEALSSDQSGDGALEDFTIARRGDGWAFEGRSSDPGEQLGNDQIPISVDELATLLKVQFRVTLPGEAASHNADEVASGGGTTTFIWKPSLSASGIDLRAATRGDGSSLPVIPIALGSVAAAATATIGWSRGRKGSPPGPSIPSEDDASSS